MATRTLGTNGTTTLTAIPWPDLTSAVQQADIAALNALITDDVPNQFTPPATPAASTPYPSTTVRNLIANSISQNGLLFVPNRGVLRLFPGDWIGVDATGWPILLSPMAISGITGGPATSWTHSGNST